MLLHQVNKTKNTQMWPAKSNKPCQVWTIVPSLFLIPTTATFVILFLLVLYHLFVYQFFNFDIFPHKMHNSITFKVQSRCHSSSLSTQPLYSSSYFPHTFSNPILLSLSHCSHSRVSDATGRDLLIDLI